MRRISLVVAVLTVFGGVGLLVARHGEHRGIATTDGHTVHADSSTAPRADPLVATTVERRNADLDAARRAAVEVVSRTDEIVTAGMFSRLVLIESFTTPSFAPVLAAETSQQVNSFLVGLGVRDVDVTGVRVLERPITATSELAAGEVTVRVWSLLVVTAPGLGVGREAWRTVTVTMIDRDGRWLVDGWSSSPGPSPAPAADTTFDDGARLDGAMSWPSADNDSGGG